MRAILFDETMFCACAHVRKENMAVKAIKHIHTRGENTYYTNHGIVKRTH